MNYRLIYNNFIFSRLNSAVGPGVYTERHHILPSCMGGGDGPENLIRLSAREHFIAHRLLAKIYPSELDLQLTVYLMRYNPQQGGKISSSRGFQILRKNAIKRITEIALSSWDGNDERKAKLLEHNSLIWNDPEFRSMMSSIMGPINEIRWKSKEFRDKVTNSNKSTWSSESKRSEHSSIMKEIWADQSRRESMSSVSSINWQDESFKRKAAEGLGSFFESNPNPWQRGKGAQNKIYWGLAGLFWDNSVSNPDCTTPLNPSKFSSIYDCGERKSIYYKMQDMFNEGWAPRKDPAWLLEFGSLGI
ncbi:MAG: HNH endonuclease signature motif containing protein [Aeromonas popoffii]|uniref:HNH endonuclease signature motif containing protein n=1 Tax=Aeromonas popoffii TaxID=70856 RepID=UPI003F311279